MTPLRPRMLAVAGALMLMAGLGLSSCSAPPSSSSGDSSITLTFTIIDHLVAHPLLDWRFAPQSAGGEAAAPPPEPGFRHLTSDQFADLLARVEAAPDASILSRPRITAAPGQHVTLEQGDRDDDQFFHFDLTPTRGADGAVALDFTLDARHAGQDRPYRQVRQHIAIPRDRVTVLLMSNGRDLRDLAFHLMAIEAVEQHP